MLRITYNFQNDTIMNLATGVDINAEAEAEGQALTVLLVRCEVCT